MNAFQPVTWSQGIRSSVCLEGHDHKADHDDAGLAEGMFLWSGAFS